LIVLKEELFYKTWETWEVKLSREAAIKIISDSKDLSSLLKHWDTPLNDMTEEELKEVFDEGNCRSLSLEDMNIDLLDLNKASKQTTLIKSHNEYQCGIEDSYTSEIKQ
jgi:hypothetical protein